ncbi:hypothetical protein RZS08_29010, partial [Arthrospira platensis SPKY1]|nr:hypothetical protein [Arthrospira platensis SPKY1]
MVVIFVPQKWRCTRNKTNIPEVNGPVIASDLGAERGELAGKKKWSNNSNFSMNSKLKIEFL